MQFFEAGSYIIMNLLSFIIPGLKWCRGYCILNILVKFLFVVCHLKFAHFGASALALSEKRTLNVHFGESGEMSHKVVEAKQIYFL